MGSEHEHSRLGQSRGGGSQRRAAGSRDDDATGNERPTVQEELDKFRRALTDLSVPAVSTAGEVWTEDAVRQRPEGAVGRERFGLEDVEHGASNRALVESQDQRLLIDDRTARSVDQNRVGLPRSRRLETEAAVGARLPAAGLQPWRLRRAGAGREREGTASAITMGPRRDVVRVKPANLTSKVRSLSTCRCYPTLTN